MIPPAGTYPGGPPRPFTAMDNQGRRPPGGRQQQPYPSVDEYSLPEGRQGPVHPGGFNGGPIPHINTPKPSQTHGNQGIKPPGTPIDIGFEAPAPRPKPAKSPAPSAMGGPGGRNSGVVDKRPGSSLGPYSQQRPPNQQGPPNKAHGSPPFGPTPGPPSPPVNPSQTPRPPPSSATPKPQSTPLPKPPGKGPKTFEEMGVPQQTKEQDCVSIPQIWRHPLFLFHPTDGFYARAGYHVRWSYGLYIYPFASARQWLSDSLTRSNYNRWLDCAYMYSLTKRKTTWMLRRWRGEGQDGRNQVTAGVFTFTFFSSLLTYRYHSNIMIFLSFLLSAATSFSFGIWLV